jgi:uncharacterized membrane protein YgcG
MIKKFISAAIGIASLAIVGSASANLIIAIDQTGANNPVNIDNPRAWNFGITQAGANYFSAHGIPFDSAMFDAKVHKDTEAPLVFSLYSGLGGNINGNTLLSRVSIDASKFDQKYEDGGANIFTFTPKVLGMGYYSATLTSTAPDKATEDYFLKQGKLALKNADGTAMDSSYWLQDNGTGDATGTFNGSGNLNNGGGFGGGGSGGGGGGGGIALAPEPGTWAGSRSRCSPLVAASCAASRSRLPYN